MKVQINTDEKHHHDDGLLNGLVVEVKFMGKDFGTGGYYKAIDINHRFYLTEEDFIELTNDLKKDEYE